MKTILASAAIVSLAIGAFADIQDPPGNDFGPTRKLGRGISNLIIAPTEFFTTGGYAEFPPEVGNESKYPYVRDTHHDFN